MSKPNRSSYLPYLFEFLVVVLGVTVSFGLDNWWHARRQSAQHARDVQSILEDLERDRERIALVQDFIVAGKEALARILEVTAKQRRGAVDYDEFVRVLKEQETPYRYATFYMNSSTYKSLLSNGRLQLFPEAVNKKLRDYYEYVSKRVDDNNDIVDRITLRYYNEDHPWVNYRHGAEALRDVGRAEAVAASAEGYFSGPGVREHYTQLSFLHGTLSVYDRVLVHSGQVDFYEQLRGELTGILEAYAERSSD